MGALDNYLQKVPKVEHCCCGIAGLEQGTKFLAIVLLVLSAIQLLVNILALSVFGLILAGLGCALHCLLLFGAIKKNPTFVQVWLIVEAVLILLYAIDLIVALVTLNVAAIVIVCILIGISVYFWVVVWSFYCTLGEGGASGGTVNPA